jgi:3-hydroxyisobutyrate dehydrogenase
MTTVAVLGTGNMGAGMARRLARRGFQVQAWNRSRDKAEPLARDGVAVKESAREAAAGAAVVITMLAEAGAVEAAMSGADGGLAGMSQGAVWLQTSTVGVDGCARLAALAGPVAFLDAPVLGSKDPAEKGELLILASGSRALEERVGAVLEAIGRKTIWLGDVGMGSRAKLVANAWVTGLTGLMAESLALARGLGVPPQRFLELIEGGSLDSPYGRMKAKSMLEGNYPPSFALRLAHKDVRLVLEAAGRPLPMATGLAQSFARAESQGHGDEDMAAVFAALVDS